MPPATNSPSPSLPEPVLESASAPPVSTVTALIPGPALAPTPIAAPELPLDPSSVPVPVPKLAPSLASAATPARAPVLAPASASASALRLVPPSTPTFQPVFSFTPAPAATVKPRSAYDPISVPAPPYMPPSAPAPTATNSSRPPTFANYRVLTHRGSPHQGGLSKMSISPTGRWIFTSAGNQERNCFALTKAPDLSLHTIINTGNLLATSVGWVSDEDFYVGFSNGDVYRSYSAPQSQDQIAKLIRVATINNNDSPSEVTAIAFDKVSGYLAIATSQTVHILRRRDYDLARFEWGLTNASNEYREIAVVRPFDSAESKINSLAFYGFSRVNLIVGASAGLVTYSMHQNMPRIIAATYDYQISQCGISADGRILAAATSNSRVIYWVLAATGPLFHLAAPTASPTCTHTTSSALSVSITSTNVIVGVMPCGQLCFTKPSSKERFVCQVHDRNLEVKAVVAHGERFYIAGAKGSDQSVEIVAYSSNQVDFTLSEGLLRQPRVFEPRYNLLSELIHEPPEMAPPETMPPKATSGFHQRYSVVLMYFCFFFIWTVMAVNLTTMGNQCVAPLAEHGQTHTGGFYLAYAGFCLIHHYIPSHWAVLVTYALSAMLSAFLLLAKLPEYM
ncbi:hypothetical protein FS749_002815 [Ceratobasidium sp. UAMH 11750]|nr:hypothetical protein FS749_002815 [Ceratobasidium sp. UAMH 11750]